MSRRQPPEYSGPQHHSHPHHPQLQQLQQLQQQQQQQQHPHPRHGRAQVVVHDHDILCGRGVSIAHHPGNERFRALVNTRADHHYCTLYTVSEKRAVAEDIIRHIKSLDPPGRFLRRDGRAQNSRGLNGPWEVLSEREAVKKTLQALRDCNRSDRNGYAASVEVPDDVRLDAASRTASGLTNKQQAEAAVAALTQQQLLEQQLQQQSEQLGDPSTSEDYLKRPRTDLETVDGRISPSIENAAEWLKKQRTEEVYPTPFGHHNTPASLAASPDLLLAPMPVEAPSCLSATTDPSLIPRMVDAISTPLAYSQHHHHHDPQAVAAALAASEMFAATTTPAAAVGIPSVTTPSPESPMGPNFAAASHYVLAASSGAIATPCAEELPTIGAAVAHRSSNDLMLSSTSAEGIIPHEDTININNSHGSVFIAPHDAFSSMHTADAPSQSGSVSSLGGCSFSLPDVLQQLQQQPSQLQQQQQHSSLAGEIPFLGETLSPPPALQPPGSDPER